MNQIRQPDMVDAEHWTPAEEVERLRADLADLRTRYTDLELRETYFRHLTEYAADLITILDADGTIRFESRSIERKLGHAPSHYRGRNVFDFVHPDDRALVIGAFGSTLQNRGTTSLIRLRFRHRDGTYRVLEGFGNNLLDDPAVRGILFNSRDVTEQLQLRDEVEHSRSEKEETIARLTGGVAHDFNNILTAIQGLAGLAQQRLAPQSPEARYLSEIQEASIRAGSLTQQLLACSHRLVLQPRNLALASWLRGLTSRLQMAVGNAIEVTVTAHGDPKVCVDPGQLEQALVQFAGNSRDAMPAGGRFTIEALPVVLEAEERPKDGRQGPMAFVQITVADQGSGMSGCVLPRIFEPFFTTKPEGNHPGLGLSMCRGIIEQSGGHMTVSSLPGRGTVFQLYIPAAESVVEEEADNRSYFQSPTAKSSPSAFTILLIDDEPLLREIGETVLLEAGYHVIVAEDGPSALQRLEELGNARLDLLLTDVVMPGMTGVQLAQEVARVHPEAAVLLCSGYTRDALARSGGLPAGHGFLPKPYTLATLLEKVEATLPAQAPA